MAYTQDFLKVVIVVANVAFCLIISVIADFLKVVIVVANVAFCLIISVIANAMILSRPF